jgi:hypothetical protein
LLSRHLCSTDFEQFFILFFSPFPSSLVDFDSLLPSELSQFSVDALDDLLSNTSIRIESEDALLRLILSLDPSYSPLLRHIHFPFLTPDGIRQFCDHFDYRDFFESLWCKFILRFSPVIPTLDSLIISEIPPLLHDFEGKQWKLLWRGSRDGFRARGFHERCDGSANTLTVILDTSGNVFGGFTPIEWESRQSDPSSQGHNCYKCDNTLESFVFTLKNPHNVPPRKFPLKSEAKQSAIVCDSDWGPYFGGGMGVCDLCNTKVSSIAAVGRVYVNDTGTDGATFFTCLHRYQVKEIEVFEIIDAPIFKMG